MKPQDHIHKYKRVLLSERTGTHVFKCQVPDCKRYLARNLVIGETSVCWKCNGSLTLTMENTSLAKPTHMECRGVKIGTEIGKRMVVNQSAAAMIEDKQDDQIDGF